MKHNMKVLNGVDGLERLPVFEPYDLAILSASAVTTSTSKAQRPRQNQLTWSDGIRERNVFST